MAPDESLAPDGELRRRARSSSGGSEPESRPFLAAIGKSCLWLGSLLSPSLAYRVGGALGWLYSFCWTQDVRTARVNLELCFPELPVAARRRLRRRAMGHTVRTFLELGRIWWRAQPGLPELVREVHGQELLDRALERGRGVLVVGPHLGSWEVMGIFMARSHRVCCIYKVPRVRQMNEIYKHGRHRHGTGEMGSGASGVRGLYRALRRNEVAWLLPDQDPGRGGGVFVPFFGHAANTGTLASRLAARSGTTVVASYARRVEGGRFDIHFSEADPEIGADDPLVGAAAVNRTIERCVREVPEQYLWSYKRFRFQPKGQVSPYKVPGAGRGA